MVIHIITYQSRRMFRRKIGSAVTMSSIVFIQITNIYIIKTAMLWTIKYASPSIHGWLVKPVRQPTYRQSATTHLDT